MDKNEERLQRFRELSEELQVLYGAPNSGILMYEVFKKFNLDEALYQTYAETVGDVILGFNRITDMPRLFQQKLGLGADESQRMTSNLIDFLEPVVHREEQEASMKKEEIAQLARAFAKPENLSTVQSDHSSATAVEPIRTMEGDIHRVHGYGAYVAERDGEPQQPPLAVAETDADIPHRDDVVRG